MPVRQPRPSPRRHGARRFRLGRGQGANHVLFDQGAVDAFGHISVRHDTRPDRFLLARNIAPGSVTAADIVEFELDGTPVNAGGRRVYLERFIHGEIFRRRPEVMAVVHSHSHAIVPLSVVKGAKLRALFHMAGFIGQDVPVFEIREAGGDATDLVEGQVQRPWDLWKAQAAERRSQARVRPAS